MPIRINLLAEEQAAEEMRRRDPIKRALYIGGALVLLMLAWIAMTQMNVSAARGELANHAARLRQLDESSKTVRSNQMLAADLQSKVASLEKYSSNRFYWGTLLDAVQHASVENIRLMEIRGEQTFGYGGINKFFTTNIAMKYRPPGAWWQFWRGKNDGPEVATVVANAMAVFTNQPPFTTNRLEYKINNAISSTNLIAKEMYVKVEFSSVPWGSEQVIIQLRGRDYGNPPGAAIDEFARRINNSPFFKELLEPGQGFRFTERPPQPRPDPQDPINPNALFVPFTIEMRLKERVFTNE